MAVEINPILLSILHLRRYFHTNKQNIKIIRADIFRMHFKNKTMKLFNKITIYLYISPWFLEKVIKNCKLKIENFNVVSYMYPVKSLKNKERKVQGKNSIFIYR